MHSVIAVLPASGSSSRMGQLTEGIPSKVLIKLIDGKTVLEHSLINLIESGIRSVIIPTSSQLIEEVKLIGRSLVDWEVFEVIEGAVLGLNQSILL